MYLVSIEVDLVQAKLNIMQYFWLRACEKGPFERVLKNSKFQFLVWYYILCFVNLFWNNVFKRHLCFDVDKSLSFIDGYFIIKQFNLNLESEVLVSRALIYPSFEKSWFE